MKIPDRDENPKAPAPKEMIDLEATFEKIESELKEVNTNAEALRRNYLELTELKEVLKKTQIFFAEVSCKHSPCFNYTKYTTSTTNTYYNCIKYTTVLLHTVISFHLLMITLNFCAAWSPWHCG